MDIIGTYPKQCEHGNTITYFQVEEVRNGGHVVGFHFIARVKCRDCGQPFHFKNLLEDARPGVRDYGTELIVEMGVGPLDPSKN